MTEIQGQKWAITGQPTVLTKKDKNVKLKN